MATAPSPNDLTRQQLDELDALLQRMLSVPLAPPDTPMPVGVPAVRADLPLPPSWRADPPAPPPGTSAPFLTLTEPAPASAPAPAPTLESLAPPPAPLPPTPAPLPPTPAPTPALKGDLPLLLPKTAAKPAPEPKPVPPPVPKAPAPPTIAPAPVPAGPPVPLPLVPLVALNALFDGACGMFGAPGRVLRSSFFKHIYGLVGIGLLAYTAAHVAQAQGLLTLPVVLPWPQ